MSHCTPTIKNIDGKRYIVVPHKIKLKRKHVMEGDPGDPRSCAIALARKEQLDIDNVEVIGSGMGKISIAPFSESVIYSDRSDSRINAFIRAFDRLGALGAGEHAARRKLSIPKDLVVNFLVPSPL